MQHKNYILTQDAIAQKLLRLAYEILENNVTETEIILAGIYPNGAIIATQLQKHLTQITNKKITVLTIALNKKQPEVITITPNITVNNKTVIVTDDVSMTGKTMAYALQPLLAQHPSKIQTLVLVERQQKNYPIHSDYVGLHISTTLHDLIIVEQQNGELVSGYMI